ncbi:CarD family transcriptional regulator [Solibacillus daqui]|uniref:CarD family transcriptional regulator n=1 Tax=Solibacillus daqui TaxID=2912187 RepID=UPI00236546AA|nr:CarD family transcriptional regulator [Solibacillus daqui]
MYKIGDLTLYKSHGICQIDSIVEQNFTGTPMQYYVLQSKLQPGVTLYHPVESDNCQLEQLLSYDEARKMLDIFSNEASEWDERITNRQRNHSQILGKNNHLEIAQLMNTILRKEQELEQQEKKLASQDAQMLQQVSMVIFDILELTLKQSKAEIEQQIHQKIQANTTLATHY